MRSGNSEFVFYDGTNEVRIATAPGEQSDCVVRYLLNGRVQAVASIYRDRESLMAEVEMERGAV